MRQKWAQSHHACLTLNKARASEMRTGPKASRITNITSKPHSTWLPEFLHKEALRAHVIFSKSTCSTCLHHKLSPLAHGRSYCHARIASRTNASPAVAAPNYFSSSPFLLSYSPFAFHETFYPSPPSYR